MMEISIFGSSYGESIVLSFDSDDGLKCGLVDCYARGEPPEENDVLQELKAKTKATGGRLAFVIATHPHDDHIRGLGQVLKEFDGRVDFFGWWGGVTMTYERVYFESLEAQFTERRRVLGVRSTSILEIMEALNNSPTQPRLQDSTDGKPDPFFPPQGQSVTVGGMPFRIRSVSPWLPQQSRYLQRLVGGVSPDGHVEEHRIGMNLTSLGLFIEYGGARVLLGGDVETGNWHYAFSRGFLRTVEGVHLVKLPHHGSPTGVPPEMWSVAGRLVTDRPQPTVAVATRYALANKTLPDSRTLSRIHDAGCEVWVVGGQPDAVAGGVNAGVNDVGDSREIQSRFQVDIHADGRVEVKPSPLDLLVASHARSVRPSGGREFV